MSRGVVAAMTIAALCGGVVSASAQSAASGRLEVAIGAGWYGGVSMTPLNVTETQANGTPRTVFDVARDLTSTAAIEARIGIRVSSKLDLEATGSYARPTLQLMPSNDVEGAAAVTASEQLQEFTVGGAATWSFVHRDASTRTIPFLTGGVSFARQLHQTSTLADSGAVGDIGGGVKRVFWTGTGKLKSVGIRADVRARMRSKVLNVDGHTHVSPLVAASLFFRF